MDSAKEQKIIVLTTQSAADETLISYGFRLAVIFNKELCLLFRFNNKNEILKNRVEAGLHSHIRNLDNNNNSVNISTLGIKEKLKVLPELLADDHEAIMIVASAPEYKKLSGACIRSPIPFLFVHPLTDTSNFSQIILPVDLRKENSDTALWCSWFGRFARSQVVAVAANEKDSHSKLSVTQNVINARKLFQKTNIMHKIYKGKRSSLYNSFEATDLALNSKADMLVLLGSSVITPLDWLIGLPEGKIIKKAVGLPVLLVNPRRDNYILCD